MTTTARARLDVRPPFAADALVGFLAARAIPGVEHVAGRVHTRSLSLPGGPATARLTVHDDHVAAVLELTDPDDEPAALAGARRLFDLDADTRAADAALGADALLGPLVRATPGRRCPGTVDGTEIAVRAIVGQQISVAGARTVLGRIVERHGSAHVDGEDVVTRRFPTAEQLAAIDPSELPMPRARGRTIAALGAGIADGSIVLDPGTDPHDARAALLALPGIGPWTASYVAMRALGDPDVLLVSDLGVRHALTALGADTGPAALRALAARVSPFGSTATHHLWASLADMPR